MPPATIIALLTDFGLDDAYVGVMKGVIFNICPQARLIDLCHTIQPQQVRQAAFVLANGYRYFPAGAIFLVVVDPGVGSSRKAIVVEAGGYVFVAPDNGVLSYALNGIEDYNAIELTNRAYQLAEKSSTFHGRDIFAPAAAYLASGVNFETLGQSVREIVALSQPTLSVSADGFVGEVIRIDHFGNIITSIGRLYWTSETSVQADIAFGANMWNIVSFPDEFTISLHGSTLNDLHHTYANVQMGELLALINSDGFLEIAVRCGNAAETLDVHVGDPVEVNFR